MTNYCAKCGRPLGTGENNGLCIECNNRYQLVSTRDDHLPRWYRYFKSAYSKCTNSTNEEEKR